MVYSTVLKKLWTRCETGSKQSDGESKPIRYCIEMSTARSVDFQIVKSDSNVGANVAGSRFSCPKDFEPAASAVSSAPHRRD